MRSIIISVLVLSNLHKISSSNSNDTLEDIRVKYDEVSDRFGRNEGNYYSTIDDQRYHDQNRETYDFIIVGSGSSGSVLANRLSEISDWKILLLEVGDEPPPFINVPAIAPLFQSTNFNWNYLMEKQDNMCLGLDDQRMAWPRGRGLGGSTLINYMIHIRGNRNDYDKWSIDLGNPGWSYRDVLQYFLKSEDASQIQKLDPNYHRTGGLLSVSDVPYRSESVHVFVRAAQEAGHEYVDYNGRSQMGVSYVQATQKRGKRWHAERAFIQPARSRPNLKVLTRSRAVKVLIDSDKKAYGIRYVRNRKYHTALASKEVILSAGAFNSPQLLILSGIGPRQHLKDLDVPLIQDLPVGRKMYDHICFLGLMFEVNRTITASQDQLYDPRSFFELIGQGKGPLTTLGGVEGLLYFKTNASKEIRYIPDIEYIYLSGSLHTDKGQIYRKTFRVTDEIYDKVWKPLEGKQVWSVLPMLMHPESYGYLELKSKNPYDYPRFYGNYLTQQQDVDAFIASIREMQRIVRESPTYRQLGTRIISTPIPGCEREPFDSDQYWECALRHVSVTLHHQVATCKMGPKDDPEAVVDNELRVYGVDRLRVVDTSIIPIPLTAHTSTPAYMVGEKAADLIKEQWVQSPFNKFDVRFDSDS